MELILVNSQNLYSSQEIVNTSPEVLTAWHIPLVTQLCKSHY